MILNIALIRSGVTEAGLQDRFLGSIDEPLARDGEMSLTWRAAGGVYPGAELVFASGLSRSLATAQIVYPRIPAIVLRELEPFDYGEFGGRTFRDLEGDGRFAKWLEGKRSLPCPGGEDPNVFVARCNEAFRRILRETEQKGLSSAAVVTHLSVIKSILRRYHLPRPVYRDWQADFGGGFSTHYDTDTGSLTISEKF